MMYRMYLRGLLASVALLMLVSTSASAKTFSVPYSGKIGTTAIEAGHYNITWEHHSPSLTVTVTKGKNVVATVSGRMEERDTKYDRNMVVYTTNEDGSQTITELRIGGTKQAIVFDR